MFNFYFVIIFNLVYRRALKHYLVLAAINELLIFLLINTRFVKVFIYNINML